MRLYLKYFSIHLRSAMQYKTSFFLTVLGQFLVSFSMFLGIYFMFSRFHTVEGFSYQEVLLCFAIVLMAFSLAECFARGFDAFPSMLGNGQFDRILVRPRGAVFQVLASKMELTRLGRLLQAVLVFAYVIPASGIVWRWDRIPDPGAAGCRGCGGLFRAVHALRLPLFLHHRGPGIHEHFY